MNSLVRLLTLLFAVRTRWATRLTPAPAPVSRPAAECSLLASRCTIEPQTPTLNKTIIYLKKNTCIESQRRPQSGLLLAWLLPRSRLYALHKAHGPVHSVVCWHLLVAPHIASPPERPLLLAQVRSATFAVSFETTHGQAHTIAVRFVVLGCVLIFG